MGSACDGHVTPFEEYVRDKEQYALSAAIPGYRTTAALGEPLRTDHSCRLVEITSPWSSALFDGPFYRTDRYDSDRPAVSLVFVQSHDGNTVADDPSTLGGGETDKHLIYEGQQSFTSQRGSARFFALSVAAAARPLCTFVCTSCAFVWL